MMTKMIKKFYPDGHSEMVEILFPDLMPEPIPTPTTEDDLMTMAIDHECRLALLELGVI